LKSGENLFSAPKDYSVARDHPLYFTPDGSSVCALEDYGKVLAWDLTANSLTMPLTMYCSNYNTTRAMAVALSADGTLLATGDSGGRIFLWDYRTGRMLAHLIGHTQPVRALTLAPNGKALASAGEEGVILLWDISGVAAAKNKPSAARVEGLPTRKAYRLANGREVTLSFDREVNDEEIAAALAQLLEQVRKPANDR
jgi:WD40 repeat protein